MAGAIRVLYVDDESVLLEIGKLFLERSGEFSVATISSAPAALDLLNKEKFDAIVSDYQMPDMDGIQFLVEVRTRFGKIPFILFTGKGREEVVIQAINNGVDFYLQKGGDPGSQFAELSHKIKQTVSRKRGEEALQESEEKYRQLVELAKEGIWAIDTEYNTTYVNPRMAEMLRYSVDEMQGQPLISFMDEPGKIIFEEKMERRRQGISEEHLFEFITKEGDRIYVTISTSPLINDKGVYQGAIAVISDITERKQAEEALKRQSATLSILNDIISTANKADDLPQLLNSILEESLRLLDFDAGGIYLVNRSTRTADVVHSINLSQEFLAEIQTLPIDKKPYDILFIQNEPIFAENYAQISQDHSKKFGFQSIASIPLLSKGVAIGALNLASMRRHPISREEKQTIISISRELGSTIERMAAEEEVKKAANNLETLFNSIEEMVFVLDMQGGILAINETVVKRLSYTLEELTGTDVLQLHVPERRDEALRFVQGMIAGTIDSCPVPVLAKDGTRIEVETKVTKGLWNNEEVLIGVSRDVTERKRVEEALKESEERHRILLNDFPDPIFSFYPDGTYRHVNQAFAEGIGKSVDQIIGKKIWEVFQKDEAEKRFSALRTVFSTGEGKEIEVRFPHSEGDSYYLTTIIPVKDESGSVVSAICSSKDITERKRAEESLLKNAEELRTHQVELETQAEELRRSHLALEESRDKFLNLYEFAPIGYLTLTDKGLIIEVNLTGATLLGVKRSKLIKARFRKFVTESDSDKWIQYFMQIMSKMEKQICNLTLIRGDDSLFHARLEGVRLTNSEGATTVRIAISDISDMRKIEETLRESELKYRSLIESSSDAVFCVDKNGEYKFTNLVFASTFNKTPDYFVGKTFWDIYPKEHADFRQMANSRMFETGVTQSVEVEVPLHGKTLFFIAKANPIKDETGKVILNLTHATDITERKRAEEALQESESFNRNLIENLPDYVLVSGPDGKILYVNPPATNALGYSIEEMNGTSVISYVAEEFRDDVISRIKACQEGKNVPPYEIDVLSLDGLRISVMVQGAPIQYRDTPALLLVLTDITSRKQTDDALRQANKKLNILSGITRHDIKNKVLIIQGFLGFAKKLKVIEEIEPILNKIQDSAKAIEHQIDFTKEYQNLGVNSPKWLNLSNMITLTSTPSIHIFAETGTLQIFADPLFEKVLHNLLDNTIRHGETATEVHVLAITEHNDIRIIWADNGVGVTIEEKEKIFQQGYGKNTGFGLFLIREILAITGMTIQENGEPGEGARFEITVPNGNWRYGSEAS